jgi:hypothetical protein
MKSAERKHEIERVRSKFIALQDCLTERGIRLWAAAEACSYGYGGITLVAEATGISDRTIRNGIENLAYDTNERPKGVRTPGGGRKKKSKGLCKNNLPNLWNNSIVPLWMKGISNNI